MSFDWSGQETSKHQDHVIAHVIGATVFGYFTADQAVHILLDIGLIWTIYLDGEMGLVPQSVGIAELDLDEDAKAALLADIQLLHEQGFGAENLARFSPAPADCLITEVSFYAHDEQRLVLLSGEEASLAVETSLATGEISIRAIMTEIDAA